MKKCEECGNLKEIYIDICQDCCEHEFDWDEGYTCLNCGKQGDIGEAMDAAEYTMEE